MGGMGIRNPVEMANIAHITSVSGTRHISDAIKERKLFSLVDHNAKMAYCSKSQVLGDLYGRLSIVLVRANARAILARSLQVADMQVDAMDY